jgi:putative ABC transport system substrate-binding protein
VKGRELIAVLGGAAAWPLSALAQQPMPVIGYLSAGSPEAFADYLTVFQQSLAEAGYVQGRNIAIEFRWSRDRPDQLSELAADLVRRQVGVVFVVANAPPMRPRRQNQPSRLSS